MLILRLTGCLSIGQSPSKRPSGLANRALGCIATHHGGSAGVRERMTSYRGRSLSHSRRSFEASARSNAFIGFIKMLCQSCSGGFNNVNIGLPFDFRQQTRSK